MLLAMAQPATAAAESLAHAIRLSMAPAFLLVGVGGLMGLMTTQRLKIVERYRVLHAVRNTGEDLVSADQIACELRVLQRRLRLTMQAINAIEGPLFEEGEAVSLRIATGDCVLLDARGRRID